MLLGEGLKRQPTITTYLNMIIASALEKGQDKKSNPGHYLGTCTIATYGGRGGAAIVIGC